ncbi:Rossmann-fold NAD(P)-binding domain-containing protein [Tellurirhabdus rosea]|uniref:oxidoreductase n=1 Tax=Tellurirhabdus rosea TaxID=2674997 RepID=UPI00225A5049|nr:oxidoreductase [Tellurirhabdus rosea]
MTNQPSKTALVIGATGLIGDLLTHLLVDSSAYERVKVLVRRPLGWQHPRLQEVQFDFDHPNGLLVQADDIFCCLGTTIKQAGSQEAFRKVDYQYPLDIARLGRSNGAHQYFLVSAMGSDVNSRIFYNRVKGEVERDIFAVGYPTFVVVRPSLLLGNRKETRLGEKVGEVVMRLFAPLIPSKYKAVKAQSVANALFSLAQKRLAGIHVVESDELRKY